VLVAASIASDFATGVGLLAGMIAVVGFLAQAGPARAGDAERKVRRATLAGGLLGFVAGAAVIVLSAFVGMVNS
jgi:hypothetical protein